MLSSIPPIARLPVDLQLEANEPCNPHWFDRQSIPRYAADSTFAGLITVQSNADGVITARVDRTVRGDLRPQALVRLNGHGFHQESSCRPVMEAPAYYRAGQHLLVFLRPDDYGVADYRLSEWGTAAVEVNDRYLTFGAPTLDLVRNALGLGVSERDTEKSSGHFALAWRLSLVVAGSLAAASAALWFASRRSF